MCEPKIDLVFKENDVVIAKKRFGELKPGGLGRIEFVDGRMNIIGVMYKKDDGSDEITGLEMSAYSVIAAFDKFDYRSELELLNEFDFSNVKFLKQSPDLKENLFEGSFSFRGETIKLGTQLVDGYILAQKYSNYPLKEKIEEEMESVLLRHLPDTKENVICAHAFSEIESILSWVCFERPFEDYPEIIRRHKEEHKKNAQFSTD